jgi:hypothetical protein
MKRREREDRIDGIQSMFLAYSRTMFLAGIHGSIHPSISTCGDTPSIRKFQIIQSVTPSMPAYVCPTIISPMILLLSMTPLCLMMLRHSLVGLWFGKRREFNLRG